MPQSDYLSMGGRIELDRFLLFFSQPVAASQSIRRPKRYVDIHKTPYHVCRSANQRCVGHLVNALGDLALTEQTAPLLRHVTCAILQSVHEAIHHPVVITETSKAQTTFAAACSYLDEHCCQAISRDDVARALQIHPTHVSRLFSQLSDKSFNQHLVQARLKRAHALLTDPTLTISQIAAMCGFNAASYFTRLYRQQYGQGPFEWRTRQFTRTTT
jgi:transcriptional regulator GlxA family with amidase domain